MEQFEDSFRDDKHDIGGEVDVPGLVGHGVEAALQDAEQLHLLEVLPFPAAGLNLVDELHPRVLIDGVDLEHVRTDATVLLRPQLRQSQDVLAVVVLVPAREAFKSLVVLSSINEAFLPQGEGLLCGLVLKQFERAFFADELIVVEDEAESLFGLDAAHLNLYNNGGSNNPNCQ